MILLPLGTWLAVGCVIYETANERPMARTRTPEEKDAARKAAQAVAERKKERAAQRAAARQAKAAVVREVKGGWQERRNKHGKLYALCTPHCEHYPPLIVCTIHPSL